MNTDSTHLLVVAGIVIAAAAMVYYFYKNPEMGFGSLRATGGGCPCTYKFTPQVYHEYSNYPPGADALHTNVTQAQLQSLCDAQPDCKGFIYDPIFQVGYLKSDVSSPKPWSSELGLYTKNS